MTLLPLNSRLLMPYFHGQSPSGRGFLGRWKWCSRCSGRGYTARPNGWQACPDCYAGRLLVSDRDGDQPVIYRAGMTMAEVEKAAIEAALREHRGNRRRAAEILGIGERTLYRKIKAYRLE